jgi:hypothetical protein
MSADVPVGAAGIAYKVFALRVMDEGEKEFYYSVNLLSARRLYN